jgi:integrase
LTHRSQTSQPRIRPLGGSSVPHGTPLSDPPLHLSPRPSRVLPTRKACDGAELRVERSIWNGGVNKPKTVCSAAPIPIVRQLRNTLEAHRQRMGELAAPDLPIFQSGIGTPMNLANVAKRVIVPRIEKCVRCRKAGAEHKPESHLFELERSLYGKGWHAFQRGLATTLHQLGTPDREIQAILRHSNVAITQASYIKSV